MYFQTGPHPLSAVKNSHIRSVRRFMGQKHFASKPNDLSSIPMTHMVEEESQLLLVVLTSTGAQGYVPLSPIKKKIKFKKI